jgi:hypothetical protein
MSYWERAPDPRLAAYVERISFSTDPIGKVSLPIRVIPDERAFCAHVGVGPKTFARIARFRAAWRALERGGRPVEVALAHGYFDQPHLVRDFVAFAGDAPRRIFPSRRPVVLASLGT